MICERKQAFKFSLFSEVSNEIIKSDETLHYCATYDDRNVIFLHKDEVIDFHFGRFFYFKELSILQVKSATSNPYYGGTLKHD